MQAQSCHYGAVVQGATLMGLFTPRSLLEAVAAELDLARTPVGDGMVTPVPSLPTEVDVALALGWLQANLLPCLGVVDSQQRFVGLVSRQRLQNVVAGLDIACGQSRGKAQGCPTSGINSLSPPGDGGVREVCFQAIFEQLNVGICQASLDGHLIDADPSLCQMLGYTREELMGMPFQQLTHPDDLELDLQKYQQLFTANLASVTLEKRYLHRDGRPIWVALTVCLVRDGQGLPQCSIGVSQDISDRKATEMALRRSEERFALAIQESKVGVWDWRPRSDELYLSPNLPKLLGYDNGPTMTTMATWQSYIHPKDVDGLIAALQAHLADPSRRLDCTYRMVHRNGQLRWMLSRGQAIRDGKAAPLRITGTHTDITAVKQAEAALRASHRRMTNILESITDAFFALDQHWRFTYLNQRAEQFLRRPSTVLLGENLWYEFPEALGTLFSQKFRQAMTQRQSLTFEDYFARTDSWYEVHVYPTHDGLAVYFQDITHRKQIEERLAHEALHDALTGTPNRTYFMEQLETAVAEAKQSIEVAFAVLFIDLDRFKIINDSLGHLVGDQLLIECARRFKLVVEDVGMVARLGGDEFAVLLHAVTDLDDAMAVADRIHAALQTPLTLAGQEIFISASVGISSNLSGSIEAVDFLRDADTAMYQAKNNGRGQSACFDPHMYEQVSTQLTLENDLQRALDRQELGLHYQPIVDLASGQLIGFEALVRWHHRRWGLISPEAFIPLAEETGLILAIGEWIQLEACQQLQRWQRQFPETAALVMHVNLSVKQFASAQLIASIDATLAQTDLSPHHLRLEITETALIENQDTAAAILTALHERGIQLCIDDFGTGYSSLGMVQQFPAQILKIDRSFIHRIDVDQRGMAMVQTILALAQNLGMTTIAEGVETDGQLTYLRQLGCPYAQGYRFSQPLPAADIELLLQTWPWSRAALEKLAPQ